jgi:hypothetical protein
MVNHSGPEPSPEPPARTSDAASDAAGLLPGSASRQRWAGAAGGIAGIVWGIVDGIVGLWPGALCLASACASGRGGHHVPVAAEHAPQPDGTPASGRPRAGAAMDGDGPALTEAAARALLAERFRAAGFRVRYDVQVARDGAFALTVDGYDPARRVGFEYVAEAESDADLDPGEHTALARDREQRILIIDAASDAEITALAERFLQALETPGPATPR